MAAEVGLPTTTPLVVGVPTTNAVRSAVALTPRVQDGTVPNVGLKVIVAVCPVAAQVALIPRAGVTVGQAPAVAFKVKPPTALCGIILPFALTPQAPTNSK